jgi:tetratricopeptide (TPR) repeat protein
MERTMSAENTSQETVPTVEELETQLQANPNDIEIKVKLVNALLDRHVFEDSKEDCVKLRRIVKSLPEDECYYALGYLFKLDGNSKAAIDYLCKAASNIKDVSTPLTIDDFIDWIFPFEIDPPEGLWLCLANVFSKYWPDSATEYTLRGMAEEDTEAATVFFVKALDRDSTYWYAAKMCAELYYGEKNWRAAIGYFCQALKNEYAQALAEIHFDLAWCYGKIKNYEAEAREYQACLKADPGYRFARNNLGWSLIKSKRYEEAVEILQESIKHSIDGKYPLRNLPGALTKLGRFEEAIQILSQDKHRGSITKTAQKEIKRLQVLLEKKKTVFSANLEDNMRDTEDEDSINPVNAENEISLGDVQHLDLKKRASKRTIPLSKERFLEEMIEEKIQQNQSVFGRRLRMYEGPDGRYGRQFVIPDIGVVDLLTEDLDTRDVVVIELKRDKGSDEVVGQTCRYVQWVRENIVKKGEQRVLGIICAHDVSAKLRYSARAVPDVTLYEYNFITEEVL